MTLISQGVLPTAWPITPRPRVPARDSPLVTCLSHRRGRQGLDSQPRDTVSFHVFHGEAPAFEVEGFSELRNSLHAGEYKAGQGFETPIAWQREPVLALQIADVDRTLEHQAITTRELRLLW